MLSERPVLVFDMDETLIHTVTVLEECDTECQEYTALLSEDASYKHRRLSSYSLTSSITVDPKTGMQTIKAGVLTVVIRPGVIDLLHKLNDHFLLCLSSKGTRGYVAAIVSTIDPTGELFGTRIIDRSDIVAPRTHKWIPMSWGSDGIAIDDQPTWWEPSEVVVPIWPFDGKHEYSQAEYLHSLASLLFHALEVRNTKRMELSTRITYTRSIQWVLTHSHPNDEWWMAVSIANDMLAARAATPARTAEQSVTTARTATSPLTVDVSMDDVSTNSKDDCCCAKCGPRCVCDGGELFTEAEREALVLFLEKETTRIVSPMTCRAEEKNIGNVIAETNDEPMLMVSVPLFD
jgi:hypothetical protein